MKSLELKFNAKTLDFIERLNRMGVPRYTISKRLSVSATSLSKYMDMANITPAYAKPGGKRRPLPMQEVSELYVCDRWSTWRIGRFFGCTHSHVGNSLKRYGVVLRVGSDCHV